MPDQDDKKPNFMGIPLAGWAIAAVSLIVVLYVAGHFSLKLYGDYQEALKEKASLQERAKEAAKKAEAAAAVNNDTSSYTNAITKEMDRHRKDGSGHRFVLHGQGPDTIYATYFESDGCIAIARPGVPLPYQPSPQASLEWSLGPDKRPTTSPPAVATPITGASAPMSRKPDSSLSRTAQAAPGQPPSTPKPTATAAKNAQLLRVQAGCWNNGIHPGQFRSWWGPANGCWAPMYRQWNDGCTHYQMFNACSGQWDPRIIWTSCNPNHHP